LFHNNIQYIILLDFRLLFNHFKNQQKPTKNDESGKSDTFDTFFQCRFFTFCESAFSLTAIPHNKGKSSVPYLIFIYLFIKNQNYILYYIDNIFGIFNQIAG